MYNPAVRELRRLVQGGELGRIYYGDSARLNLGVFQRQANVAWDLAPHDTSGVVRSGRSSTSWANLIQLAAVIAAAALGWRSPALFLIIYGLSSVAALALMAPFGGGLRLRGEALRWSRMLGIAGFLPVRLKAVFWNGWFKVDLQMFQHLRTAAETDTYAAAKTIANGFTLILAAIAFVFAQRVAQLTAKQVRGHLTRVLGFTTVATVPLATGVMRPRNRLHSTAGRAGQESDG